MLASHMRGGVNRAAGFACSHHKQLSRSAQEPTDRRIARLLAPLALAAPPLGAALPRRGAALTATGVVVGHVGGLPRPPALVLHPHEEQHHELEPAPVHVARRCPEALYPRKRLLADGHVLVHEARVLVRVAVLLAPRVHVALEVELVHLEMDACN